ncbi:MAG: SDR family NAD(P)-dependent oxidoreductase [Fervidobacterium sp.]
MIKYELSSYRWALVTGASSGIGKEFALQLASKGLDVVIVGRNGEALTKVADEIHKISSSSVVIIQADLTKEFDHVLENLSHFKIDLLVNNAGLGLYGDFLDHGWQEYENIIDLNIKVLTKLSHHYAKKFAEQKSGGIINIASVAGFMPIPHFSVYGATKAYVYNFSMSLWAELRNKGVHVLCVAPGKTETRFFERARMNPGKGLMKPNEVVEGSLKAFEKGSPLYIPGFGNKLTYHLVRRIFTDKFLSKTLVRYF